MTKTPTQLFRPAARARFQTIAGAVGFAALAAAAITYASIPVPMTNCAFLVLLKREAMHCGPQIAAHENAETRLACAERRALRVANTGGHAPPDAHEALIAAFAALDAAVHAGTMSPAEATRRLERLAGSDTCLGASAAE